MRGRSPAATLRAWVTLQGRLDESPPRPPRAAPHGGSTSSRACSCWLPRSRCTCCCRRLPRCWRRGGRCRTWTGPSRSSRSPARPPAWRACGSWTGSRWEQGPGSRSPPRSLPGTPSAGSCRARPRRSRSTCCVGLGSTPAGRQRRSPPRPHCSLGPRRPCRCWRCRRSSAARRSAAALPARPTSASPCCCCCWRPVRPLLRPIGRWSLPAAVSSGCSTPWCGGTGPWSASRSSCWPTGTSSAPPLAGAGSRPWWRRWGTSASTIWRCCARSGRSELPPRPSLVLLAYTSAELLALVPFTPGGLGFVEAGLVGTLKLAGVPGP
jgi:hypothetical protein